VGRGGVVALGVREALVALSTVGVLNTRFSNSSTTHATPMRLSAWRSLNAFTSNLSHKLRRGWFDTMYIHLHPFIPSCSPLTLPSAVSKAILAQLLTMRRWHTIASANNSSKISAIKQLVTLDVAGLHLGCRCPKNRQGVLFPSFPVDLKFYKRLNFT